MGISLGAVTVGRAGSTSLVWRGRTARHPSVLSECQTRAEREQRLSENSIRAFGSARRAPIGLQGPHPEVSRAYVPAGRRLLRRRPARGALPRVDHRRRDGARLGGPAVGPFLGRSVPVGSALVLGVAVLAARLALSLGGVRVSAHLTADVTTDQRRVLSHAYLGTSWDIQQSQPAGRLQELLTTFVQRVNQTIATLAQGITALLSLIAFLGTGLVIDPASTIAVLMALGVVGAILTPLRRRVRQRSVHSAQAGIDFASAVSELGSLGLEMQTFGVQPNFAERIDALTYETAETQRRVQSLRDSLAPIYMSLAYAAVLGGVAVLTMTRLGDVAVIGAVILLMLRSLSYGSSWPQLQASSPRTRPFLIASLPPSTAIWPLPPDAETASRPR